MRKIIHIDMDAFYASVEQRDFPALRGKPMAVGSASGRGVVAAASYEAREFGVRSAMPSSTALRKCPQLVFVPHRFDVYRGISRQIRAIFAQYTDLIEPLSLDEAYLDVSHDLAGIGSASQIARQIRGQIFAETGLTASAGVSYNKFIAKLASDQHKPDGLCIIRPEDGAAFVATMPVRRFHGIGPRMAEKMARLGIETGQDLRAQPIALLRKQFGNHADYLFQAARGIDLRAVDPRRAGHSIGAERTFDTDLRGDDIAVAMEQIADILWHRLQASEAQGRTVTLKLRLADFTSLTRSITLATPLDSRALLGEIGRKLLDELGTKVKAVRLLGLTLSGMLDANEARQEKLAL